MDIDIHYEKSGSLFVFETDEEIEAGKKLVAEKREFGVDLYQLDAYEVHEKEPKLAPDIVGGIFTRDDAQVDPMLLTFGLAEAAKKRGAQIFQHTEVTGIRQVPGQLIVSTVRGDYRARNVINAAGVWAPVIGNMLGIDIPIIPRQGQLLVSENVERFVSCSVTEYGYMMTKYAENKLKRNTTAEMDEFGVAMLVEPRHGNNLLIGSCRRFVGYNEKNDYRVISAIAQRACRFFPALRSANMIRSYAGLRPYTADQNPIISRTPVDGFYIAAGHEGAGITLSLITGQLMSEIICGKPLSFPEAPFSLARFEGNRLHNR